MKKLLSIISILFLVSCAEVPKEVPELSMRIGDDIASMQTSHRQLVRTMFENFRKQRLDYLKYEWTPLLIKNMVEMGKLKEIASGQLVFDEENSEFVDPTPGLEMQQMSDSLLGWSGEVIRQIKLKEAALIQPLNQREKEILASIDKAYNRMLAANAQVTGFLTSLRNVEAMQDEYLNSLGLGGMRQEINDKIVEASVWAQNSLQKVKEADGVVNDISDKLDGSGN